MATLSLVHSCLHFGNEKGKARQTTALFSPFSLFQEVPFNQHWLLCRELCRSALRRIRPLTISLVARLEAAAVVARNGFVIRPRPEMDDTQLRPSAARFVKP